MSKKTKAMLEEEVLSLKSKVEDLKKKEQTKKVTEEELYWFIKLHQDKLEFGYYEEYGNEYQLDLECELLELERILFEQKYERKKYQILKNQEITEAEMFWFIQYERFLMNNYPTSISEQDKLDMEMMEKIYLEKSFEQKNNQMRNTYSYQFTY